MLLTLGILQQALNLAQSGNPQTAPVQESQDPPEPEVPRECPVREEKARKENVGLHRGTDPPGPRVHLLRAQEGLQHRVQQRGLLQQDQVWDRRALGVPHPAAPGGAVHCQRAAEPQEEAHQRRPQGQHQAALDRLGPQGQPGDQEPGQGRVPAAARGQAEQEPQEQQRLQASVSGGGQGHGGQRGLVLQEQPAPAPRQGGPAPAGDRPEHLEQRRRKLAADSLNLRFEDKAPALVLGEDCRVREAFSSSLGYSAAFTGHAARPLPNRERRNWQPRTMPFVRCRMTWGSCFLGTASFSAYI